MFNRKILRRKAPRIRVFLVILGLAVCTVAPAQSSYAMNRDVRSVLVAGTYGLVGGTVVGAATYPLHHSVKGVFIGSAVGLYLGLVVGLYHVMNRDDPDNPFHAEAVPAMDPPGMRRDPYLVDHAALVLEPATEKLAQQTLLTASFPVFRF